MNRLENEYLVNDSAEERRVIFAIVMSGAFVFLIMMAMVGVILLMSL